MIDPKDVAERAVAMVSAHFGHSAGPNIREMVNLLALTLTDAINAELRPLLDAAAGVLPPQETPLERGNRIHKEIEQKLLDDGLSNAPARWKCRALGCPDRPAVAAAEAPRCYTCDRRMEKYEPAWMTQSPGDIIQDLENLSRKICAAGAMPAELLNPSRPPREPDDRRWGESVLTKMLPAVRDFERAKFVACLSG